eukprot:scaffold154500_cov43-Attheya_sp.AAC.1
MRKGNQSSMVVPNPQTFIIIVGRRRRIHSRTGTKVIGHLLDGSLIASGEMFHQSHGNAGRGTLRGKRKVVRPLTSGKIRPRPMLKSMTQIVTPRNTQRPIIPPNPQ